MLVTSDAHEGLRRATRETFQGAAWQRCAVHLIRDCLGSRPDVWCKKGWVTGTNIGSELTGE
jgi:hypothetical protein